MTEIVSKKLKTIETADEIGSKLIKIFAEEIKPFLDADDPGEIIYLSMHSAANFMLKVCLSLEGYSDIYKIEKLTYKYTKKCIMKIMDEYDRQN